MVREREKKKKGEGGGKILEKLKVDLKEPSLCLPLADLSTINPGLIKSVDCSSSSAIT